MKMLVVSLILFSILSVDGFAREYSRWHLPEGAKLRLGKGRITQMKYSPNGSRQFYRCLAL